MNNVVDISETTKPRKAASTGGSGGGWDLETRVSNLEADMKDVKRILTSIEKILIEIQADLKTKASKEDLWRVETKLTAEIARVETKLTADIARVELKLTSEIARVESRLSTDIARIELDFKSGMSHIELKFSTDMARLENEFKNALLKQAVEVAEVKGYLKNMPTWWMFIVAIVTTWSAGAGIIKFFAR